jgi:hypothetical protein
MANGEQLMLKLSLLALCFNLEKAEERAYSADFDNGSSLPRRISDILWFIKLQTP